MSREFHIFAFDAESRFTVKGAAESDTQEFSSLFSAACHVRAQLLDREGLIVVYDGKIVNRIPVYARP
jgi:hypothetical protein